MSNSSFVGMTQTRTRESSVLMTDSQPPRHTEFCASSSAMPNQFKFSQIFLRIFADAARKDYRVRAVHCRQICADILGGAVTENFDGKARPAVVGFFRLGNQLAHIV